jgi:hypothetical protein
MKICYICHRTEEEVRNILVEQLQTELQQEEQFTRIEMENENKKILDLQEEWEILKKNAANDISNIMGNDIFYLLKNVAANQNIDLKQYFDKAGSVLGNSINSIKVKDIEAELKDKIDKIKNLSEYNNRLDETRKRYQSTIDDLNGTKDLIKQLKIKLSNSSLQKQSEVNIEVCDVCLGIVKSNI